MMTLFRLIFTVLVTGGLLAVAGSAEAQPTTRLQSTPELAPFMERADAGDLLVIESARSRRLTVLSIAELGTREIVGPDRTRLRVDRAYDTALAEHRRMSRDLERIPAAALVRRSTVTESVVELDDSYILLRKFDFTVRDPELARQHSSVFAELVEPEPSAATARTAGMPAELQADFQRFLDEELPLLEPDDPLRIAYQRGGPDAVLRAALAGQGRHEITDQIVVPKQQRAPPGLGPSSSLVPLSREARPLQAAQGPPLRGTGGPQPLHPDTVQPYTGLPKYHLEPGVRTSGELKYDESFLAGFSFGTEARWERKWGFGVGYFRLSAGYGYSIGLRMPLRLQGELAPTRIESSQHLAPVTTLQYRIRVVPFDASASQYATMGVPADLVFGGHEFVLFAYAKWGYKLRAFGKTWTERPYKGPEFDASSHFVPPLGKSTEFATLVIPSALTQTEINLGVLKGYVQFGVGLIGLGSAKSQTQLVYDGQRPADQRHSLVATNSDWHSRDLTLPAIPFQMDYYTVEHHFGVEQSAPAFALDVDAIARLRAGMGVKVDVWVGTLKKTLNTPWFDVLRMSIVSVELGPHPGTSAGYAYNGGRRVHEMRKVQGLTPIRQDTVRPLRQGRAQTGAHYEALVDGKLVWVEPTKAVVVELEQLLPRAIAREAPAPVRQEMGGFEVRWGGDAQVFWRAPAPRHEPTLIYPSLELPLSVTKAGRYDVTLHYTAAPDYGSYNVLIGGELRAKINGYAQSVTRRSEKMTNVLLRAGDNQLIIAVHGRDLASTNYFVGLDSISLWLSAAASSGDLPATGDP